ncbi:MAG: DUF3343 domain-containing protein [Ruminococcaceae bacterium]|nr:DUF3343 domain-containing protein [Oscillospiraceae bacterium]
METALIAFSSSTTANRLKKLAVQEQIRGVTMIQTPKAISQNGCTYSLRCPMGTLKPLLQLAEAYHIKHGHVYRENTDGNGRRFYEGW